MLFGETSLVKPESLYAYYNAMLFQKINFLNIYLSIYVNTAHNGEGGGGGGGGGGGKIND